MSRRKERPADLDFVIHQDHPPITPEDQGSDGGDLSRTLPDTGNTSSIGKNDDNDTLLNGDDTDSHEPKLTAESDMTKASTLVDGKNDNMSRVGKDKNVESTIDSMLQELKDGVEQVDSPDTHSVPSSSRRESAVTGTTQDDGYTTEDYGDHETDSRRESSASHGTYESSRRSSHAESRLDNETELDNSTVDYTDGHDSFVDGDTRPSSRRESLVSATSSHSPQRRTSVRTEALIHAAARGIVERLNQSNRDVSSHADDITDAASMSGSERTSIRHSDVHESLADESIVESVENDEQHTASLEEGGDSSSHHENDDDVFSERSSRSSIGSASDGTKTKMDNITHRSKSPRISDFSHYDDASNEDEDEEIFIPTIRGTPRPAFRSPSSVKAIQMSSPTPSRLGSSRSSRRTPLPTVSRLGSPSLSAQYSPRKTPPRFKRNNTPPLVLLHATILPLRWPWGGVLDNCHAEEELSDGVKGLRDAWRLLQDRMGDTVCERGILLPHPQNDFEVLEERLLEALELPLRRRARILECGHYLGPSNEMALTLDDTDTSEDECDQQARRSAAARNTHWCTTCKSEIRFDSLGAGKIFRAKVYASNGLVKAGAWEACWKEMERVDVEVEPIVEPGLHEDLVRLEKQQHEGDGALHEEEHDPSYIDHEATEIHHLASSPAREIPVPASSPDHDRRMRDEERLREIYGSTPPSHAVPTADAPPASDYVHHQTPPSPSVEAYARRKERRRQMNRNESLPELLLEAFRVMMQDRKNVVIALMSVAVLLMALRSGSGLSVPEPEAVAFHSVTEKETVTVTNMPEQTADSKNDEMDPCESPESLRETVSERIVRIVETVTQTVQETMAAETQDTLDEVEEAEEVKEPVETGVPVLDNAQAEGDVPLDNREVEMDTLLDGSEAETHHPLENTLLEKESPEASNSEVEMEEGNNSGEVVEEDEGVEREL